MQLLILVSFIALLSCFHSVRFAKLTMLKRSMDRGDQCGREEFDYWSLWNDEGMDLLEGDGLVETVE